MFQERVSVSSDTLKANAHASERPLYHSQSHAARGAYASFGKRIIDISGALAIGTIFLPLILAVALIVRFQGGSMIFGHERIGKNGRSFHCLKFRTMVMDADRRLKELLERDPAARAEWEQHRKLDNDPRITRLGNILRKTSLDELPQLWNVIRGDMSLVGPRPVTAKELHEKYAESSAAYMSVRPGLTGPWQVSGRNNISYEERVRMDRHYAQTHSLPQDIAILARTVMVVVGATGK
ncbi:MAG: sugar transferase [Paracoccus sp. (in: a-proteobacteria)]|uniref:sugar transferase n=1 Tax=Paracoccus sp. TaxID=267 RepID=UPI0039E3B03C